MTVRNTYTYDNLLLLKDAGAMTASGACTVGGQPRVLDLGAARTTGRLVVDTSVLDTADANETYRVALQGSNDITFATGVVELGSVTVTAAGGRNEGGFSTAQGSTFYRYVRAFITVSGTTPSINATVFIGKE